MRRARLPALAALLLGWARLVAGQAEPSVEILRPPPEPLVGSVEIEVEALPPAAVERVELEIDGTIVHRWRQAPFRLTWDFGVSGAARRLEARAMFAGGAVRESVLESPAIRIDELVDLELQQLYVTVEDRRGARRLDLARSDFTVLDNGGSQEVVTFAAGNVPFTAALLIDASESMRGRRLGSALEGARRFIRGMRELDRAQLIAFSEQVLAASAVADRGELLGGTTRSFTPHGGTAIRDHLFVALRLLESRQGRRAVVLLSDGWDQLSVLRDENLWRAAERSQSTVYWVRLAGDEPTPFWRPERIFPWGDDFAALRFRFHPGPSSWNDEAASRKSYGRLEELVEMTGGRILTADTAEGLGEAMGEVLEELHQQYALGYYPTPRGASGEWRPVSVRLAPRGLRLRTRTGYVER